MNETEALVCDDFCSSKELTNLDPFLKGRFIGDIGFGDILPITHCGF